MLLRPLLRPLLRKLLRPLIAPAQRIFIDLDPVLESHYTVQNPVVETGDFEYTVEYATTSEDAINLLSGASASFDSIILDLNLAGLLRAFAFVGATIQDIASVSSVGLRDDKLRTAGIRYTSSSGLIELLSGGATVTAGTWALNGSQDVAFFGARGGTSNFFNGIIANPDLGNGNAWKLDRATGNTEQAANGNNILTGNNIPDSNKELFQFNAAANQWENISPQPQNLPAIIEVA